jgi:drug/metabolite transporter (DMT)-like permease
MTTGRALPDGSTLLAFVGVALLGGVNAIAVKKSVEELEPFWSAGLRFAVAGALLVAIVLGTRRPFPRGRSSAGAAVYGAIAFSASFAFITPPLRDVPAGTAIVLLALVPLETFGVAILQRQEHFHAQDYWAH